MPRDIMIDLETASSESDAAILAIGAVEFDREEEPVVGEDGLRSYPHFYVNVDLQSCIDAGLKVSGPTFYWWLQQEEAARNALTNPEPVSLQVALGQFTGWLLRPKMVDFQPVKADSLRDGGVPVPEGPPRQVAMDPDDPYIWSHATFGTPILATAYNHVYFDVPWKFRMCRDLRTIQDAAYGGEVRIPGVPEENKHDALWDAYRQAVMVQRCWRRWFWNDDAADGLTSDPLEVAGGFAGQDLATGSGVSNPNIPHGGMR